MSSHRWTRCLLLSALLLLVTSFTYAQSAPGVCSDTWAGSCTSTNTCPAPGANPPPPTCTVQISHAAGTSNAIMQYGGQTITDICVYPGQPIAWQEADQSAQFLLLFLSTPFTSNTFYFTGSTGSNGSGTIVSSPPTGCFEFSIRQQVGSTIYSADPKVVVHGVGK